MKDSKKYCRFNNDNNTQNSQHSGGERVSQSEEENIREKVDYYSSMSENQLYDELFKEVVKGKQNGTLTREGLMNFYNMVIPLLNEQQRQKLDEIIKKLDI